MLGFVIPEIVVARLSVMPRPQDKVPLIIAMVLDAYLIAGEFFGPYLVTLLPSFGKEVTSRLILCISDIQEGVGLWVKFYPRNIHAVQRVLVNEFFRAFGGVP
jgi:hypothetical protein